MAFTPSKKDSKGPKGPHTPIKEYPALAGQPSPQSAAPAGSAPKAPAASKSTNAQGPQAATEEPKLSPEAEAARAQQGAITVLTATGPAVAPPPDPRASYQVGQAEDNTPLVSFTALASAAQQKGKPSTVLPPTANSDLKEGKADGTSDAQKEKDSAPDEEKAAPEAAGKKSAASKKPPFGK